MDSKPRKKEKRIKFVNIACTPSEKELLKLRAEEQGLSIAEYVRLTLRGIISPRQQIKAG